MSTHRWKRPLTVDQEPQHSAISRQITPFSRLHGQTAELRDLKLEQA
ncbi:hypothetical protein [Nonomuraea sp. NPDC005692]